MNTTGLVERYIDDCLNDDSYFASVCTFDALPDWAVQDILALMFIDDRFDAAEILLDGSFNFKKLTYSLIKEEIRPHEYRKKLLECISSDYEEMLNEIIGERIAKRLYESEDHRPCNEYMFDEAFTY